MSGKVERFSKMTRAVHIVYREDKSQLVLYLLHKALGAVCDAGLSPKQAVRPCRCCN